MARDEVVVMLDGEWVYFQNVRAGQDSGVVRVHEEDLAAFLANVGAVLAKLIAKHPHLLGVANDEGVGEPVEP